MMSTGASRFRLVLGTHDLAPDPVATGDELSAWMPFGDFVAFYDRLDRNAARTGVSIEITSDDAFASDYTLLLPWLLDNGRTASFFVPTAFLDRPGRLSRTQLREMRRLGMRIGTHGTNHIDWARSPDYRDDILRGIAALEDLLGEPIVAAAPPFGQYNARVLRLLAEEDVIEVYTCNGGYAVTDGMLRTRVAVASDPAVNDAILQLSARAPGNKDWWRGQWHRLRDLPALTPRWA
jgi:peptidoglycan/xylan/chitin deacetylase (PgdA/CDA1 family)